MKQLASDGAPDALFPKVAQNLAVNGASVFVAGIGLVHVSLSDSSATQLPVNSLQIQSIALDEAFVYFTDTRGASRVGIDSAGGGSGKETLLGEGPGATSARTIAVDSRPVYWVSGGDVRRVAKPR